MITREQFEALIYLVGQARESVRYHRNADADAQLQELERALGAMLPPIVGELRLALDGPSLRG